MSFFTPGRRWQPAYYPFHKPSLAKRSMALTERVIKGVLFGCRMCGNCLLQETAFICPMECPKGLRNGPCGGSTPESCYVDPGRPCIWYRIYERAEKMGRVRRLFEVLPPLDWSRVGCETWWEVWQKVWSKGLGKCLKLAFTKNERPAAWENLFRGIRQPGWWLGDDQPHPALVLEPVSNLQARLTAGGFVITAEIAPPLAASPEDVIKKLNLLRDYIDAANFTDNPSATPRMSSLACSVLAVQQGIEPVMQIAGRDRNRMGLQAEILGAAALGIRNVLCLTGDHSSLGPPPAGRMDIWDMDSIQMIWLLRRLRDDGFLLDQRPLKTRPQLFIGAAASPYAANERFQAWREQKKVNAGAQFFQSNLVYDVEGFERYLSALEKTGLLGHVPILAGITPLRSLKAARAMSGVPGVKIPTALFARMEKAADPKEEGVQIALEVLEKIKRLPGIRGIHFMAVGWESIVPRLVTESGLGRSKAPAEVTTDEKKH